MGCSDSERPARMKLNLKCFVLVGAWVLASSLCAAEQTQIYHIMVPKSLAVSLE